VPGTVIPRLRSASSTTPGRLTVSMVGLILLSVLTGIVGLVTIQDKANTLDDLVNHREPVNAAAQQIYRSLSDADATAASAFLAGAIEPAADRTRYQTDIQQAGAALAIAATDSFGVDEAAKPLSDLAISLPVYTGLIERASANNELGYPVGAAFLGEADNLMRTTLLPAAQQLYTIDTQRLAAEQDQATALPWLTLILIILLAAALVLTQRYLSRRTNRTVNLGLALASIAVIVAVVWGGVGLVLESVYVNHGQSSGSNQVDQLSQARIAALQARTDEVLTLVARGSVDYTKQFDTLANQIGGKDGSGGLLGQVLANSSSSAMSSQVQSAVTAAKKWFTLHDQVDTANTGGDYQTAVNVALGNDRTHDEATAFDQVDTALGNAIQAGRSDFLRQTDTAGNWLTALPIGVLVLFLVAAFGSTFGIWQRLREYR
jgi:hypothetical protein